MSRIFLIALAFWPTAAANQELEPRALSPAPVGATFLLAGFGSVRGAVVVDPILPADSSYFPGRAEGAQDPFVALQAHVNYTFDSGIWIGLDSAWFSGGPTRVMTSPCPIARTTCVLAQRSRFQ